MINKKELRKEVRLLKKQYSDEAKKADESEKSEDSNKSVK